ncbi:hypothetical protein GCM10010278_66710 [Streptomyces melanogenes]|nr:hypothetical protein GCM10010278_66710 [Streptomyces melanogenes]
MAEWGVGDWWGFPAGKQSRIGPTPPLRLNPPGVGGGVRRVSQGLRPRTPFAGPAAPAPRFVRLRAVPNWSRSSPRP